MNVPDGSRSPCALPTRRCTPIGHQWPDQCTIAYAVAPPRLSAVLACERNGTAARGQKGYRAAHELGTFCCELNISATRWTIPDFRRATLRLLNDNERIHMLQRQIRRAG